LAPGLLKLGNGALWLESPLVASSRKIVMPRFALPWLALVVASIAVADDSKPPALPRDTLPADLSVEAIPFGLERDRSIPRDNPLTAAKVRLGRRLFFDPILSADGTVACASCHHPDHGFAGPARFVVGINGQRSTRKAPTLLNRAYGSAFFWDGREATLEAQALRPIESPREMGATLPNVVQRLQKHPEYPALFRAAFPAGRRGVTADNLARALASFERVLLSGNTRVDRFRAGELRALNERERHGLWLYESRGQCWRCHTGANFTDEAYHNTGVGWGKEPVDLGRYTQTKIDGDRGRFKTPTLRSLAATAPYMHDGSLPTLEAVVEFYNQGGAKNPHLDPRIVPLGLSKEDQRDLVAFLKALSPEGTASGER
jgi:cytochrome c peroxidase